MSIDAIISNAKIFEDLRSFPRTEAAETYAQAKNALKASYKAHEKEGTETLQSSSVLDKTKRKIAEWQKQVLFNASTTLSALPFNDAVQQFEKAYVASCQDAQVMAVRSAKKEFKQVVFSAIKSGTSVSDIQNALKEANFGEKTLAKVAYWANKASK